MDKIEAVKGKRFDALGNETPTVAPMTLVKVKGREEGCEGKDETTSQPTGENLTSELLNEIVTFRVGRLCGMGRP